MPRLWIAFVLWIFLAALLSADGSDAQVWRGIGGEVVVNEQLIHPLVAVDESFSRWKPLEPLVKQSYGTFVDESSSMWKPLDLAAFWLQKVANSVSDAFWGFAGFLERSRRDLSSKLNNLVLRTPSFKSPFANSGATEPLAAIIPEPPTLSHKHGPKAKLFFIVDRAIRTFSSFDTRPNSCLGAVDEELLLLREIVKTGLKTTFCASAEGDFQASQFCKLVDADSEMAVDMVFSDLNINQVDVVKRHVEHNLRCPNEFKAGHWQMNALALGHMFHETNKFTPPVAAQEPHLYAAMLYQMAKKQLPSLCLNTRCSDVHHACRLRTKYPNLFSALFSSTFRPWTIAPSDVGTRRIFRYRRAMLFRIPHIPRVDVHLRVATFVSFDSLGLGIFKELDKPELSDAQANKVEDENNPDKPLIRMTGSKAGAAAI